jgi:uncharacterized protein YggE
MRGLPQNVVIVSGSGAVSMVPDLVSFNLGVETAGTNIRAIVDENNAKVAKILAALKARGVKPAELQTSQFQLEPYEVEETFAGYRVSNQIGVTREGIADAGELIGLAIDAGANEVRGPQFSIRNEKAVQDRCLGLAFADARGKALRLATLAERSLGKVLAVTDGSSSPFEFNYRSPGVEPGVFGYMAMEPGVANIDCGVTAAFRLD